MTTATDTRPAVPDGAPPTPRRQRRRGPRVRIRTKLAAALAVPLLGLGTVAGVAVVAADRAAAEVEDQTRLATASIGPGGLLVSLQDERNRVAIDLIGLGALVELPVADLDEAAGNTDVALAGLRAEVGRAGTEVRAAFAPAFDDLAALDGLRGRVERSTRPEDLTNQAFADLVFGTYTALIATVLDAGSALPLSIDDAELRNGAEVIDAVGRIGDLRARIVRSLVLAVLDDGGLTEADDIALVADLDGQSNLIAAQLLTTASGPFAPLAEATFAEPDMAGFDDLIDGYLAGDEIDLAELLDVATGTPDQGITNLRTVVAAALGDEADQRLDDASTLQRNVLAAAAAGIVAALVCTWLASRSITRPLRSLTGQAAAMADVRLPTAVQAILDTPLGDDVVVAELSAVSVRTTDEVADVAGALTTVQDAAIGLAVEQTVLRRNIADAFVHLGRRNQNLLSRQLDFITELERHETDPDTLRDLFRLDHLATRMRRNAESLLVLAGLDAPRQWSAPVALPDVVRAALGEVEDYPRVVLRTLDPVRLTGGAAADVTHLLAELLENALAFSPPTEAVEVRGRLSAGRYVLAVVDQGIGLDADDLARANVRLAGNEAFTVAPSRYLGHYVAGRLAARHGIVVELLEGAAGGTIAKVVLPAELLEAAAPPPPALLPGDPPAAPTLVVADPVTGEEQARPAPVPTAVAVLDRPAPTTTPNGLVRRVRGAQRPDTVAGSAATPPAPAAPPPATDLAPASAATAVAELFSSFQSGVHRGHADAGREANR